MTAERRTLALAVVALSTATAVAWVGRVAEGRAALAESDAALARGETASAIHAARVAALARCPTCDAPQGAYDRLERIAREAEAKGEDGTAFAAWGAVRAAALGGAVLGGGTRRVQAEGELARLGQKIDATAAALGGAPAKAASEERLRAALAQGGDALPSGGTFALIAVGAVAFAAGALRMARAPRLHPTDGVLAAAGVLVAALALALF